MALLVPAPLRTAIQSTGGAIVGVWWQWFGALFSYLSGFQTFGSFPASTTLTGAGSMTITGVTINQSELRQVGTIISFYLDVSFTTGGAAAPIVMIALPVQSLGYGQFTARVNDGGIVPALAWIDSGTGQLFVRRADGANWGLGAGREIIVSGSYTASL